MVPSRRRLPYTVFGGTCGSERGAWPASEEHRTNPPTAPGKAKEHSAGATPSTSRLPVLGYDIGSTDVYRDEVNDTEHHPAHSHKDVAFRGPKCSIYPCDCCTPYAYWAYWVGLDLLGQDPAEVPSPSASAAGSLSAPSTTSASVSSAANRLTWDLKRGEQRIEIQDVSR